MPPTVVPAATKEDLLKQGNMHARLVAMRKASFLPRKRRAGQRKGGAFLTPPRADLSLDTIPTLPEHTTRGKVRVRLVTPAMSTSGYPDMNAMLTEIMRNDRSIPNQVEHNRNGTVIRKSFRSTASDYAGYVAPLIPDISLDVKLDIKLDIRLDIKLDIKHRLSLEVKLDIKFNVNCPHSPLFAHSSLPPETSSRASDSTCASCSPSTARRRAR